MHTLLITHRSRSGLLASEGTRQTSSSTPSASYHCWRSRCDRPPALPRHAPSSSGLRASANTASYARRPSTSGGTVLARPPCRQQCPSVSWSRRWSHSRPRGREKAQSHRPGRAYGALRGDPTRPSRRHELPGPCATLHCCLTHCSSHSELWSRPVLFPHSLDRYPCSRPLPCTFLRISVSTTNRTKRVPKTIKKNVTAPPYESVWGRRRPTAHSGQTVSGPKLLRVGCGQAHRDTHTCRVAQKCPL